MLPLFNDSSVAGSALLQAVPVLVYSQVYGTATTWAEVQREISRLDPFAIFGLASQWNAIVQDPSGESAARESARIVRAIGEPRQLHAIQTASDRIMTNPGWTLPFPPPVVHRRQLLILDDEWPDVGPYDHPWVQALAEDWRKEMVVHLFPDGETVRRVRSGSPTVGTTRSDETG